MNNSLASVMMIALSIGLGNVACGGSAPPASAADSTVTTSATADRDGDGIADATDKCPDQKEDGQAPDPKDGCPSTATATTSAVGDRDGDGIPDSTDKCPDQKEDGQAPDPKDGCPKT
jgi:hypothetical protein